MSAQPFIVCSAARTAALLDFPALVDALRQAAGDYAQARIRSPERLVVPLPHEGVMLSMPATAEDVAIHKLVNVQPGNRALGLPTIHGQVSAFDARTGRPLFQLDGPEVTGRRTAAVSMLAIDTLLPAPPRHIMLIGTGTQAVYHLQAIHALYPQAKVQVRGRTSQAAVAFCQQHQALHPYLQAAAVDDPGDRAEVIITLTTSTVAVYNEQAVAGKLLIGVGAFKPQMAEIGALTLAGSDIYVDDPAGARHEAGDLIQAEIDWARTRSLATALQEERAYDRPVVFKSVGTAAWDLAACRVARRGLGL